MINAKEFDRKIDLSNDLKRIVNLVHINQILLCNLMSFEDLQHNNIFYRLNDMTSLNQVIISELNHDADVLIGYAENSINS